MTIYTKKGDKGTTSTIKKINGKTVKISKASTLINTIGAVDEANSYLGIVVSELKMQKSNFKTQWSKLEDVQRDLFSIGSILAGASIGWNGGNVDQLEKDIDVMVEKMPVLTGFILPGGSKASAYLMYARTLVRKAERRVVGIKKNIDVKHRPAVIKYMNRLSDYLFILARWINFRSSVREVKWVR